MFEGKGMHFECISKSTKRIRIYPKFDKSSNSDQKRQNKTKIADYIVKIPKREIDDCTTDNINKIQHTNVHEPFLRVFANLFVDLLLSNSKSDPE